MTYIDNAIGLMVRDQIERLVFISDDAAHVYSAQGLQRGQVVPLAHLIKMLNEVMAPDWRSTLAYGTMCSFFRNSPHGNYFISVARDRNSQTGVEELEVDINSKIPDDVKQEMAKELTNQFKPGFLKPRPSNSQQAEQKPSSLSQQNTTTEVFRNCGSETEFVTQWFRVDPNGLIVNVVPPEGKDAEGFGSERYVVSEILPDGLDYIGLNIAVLSRAAKALSLKLGRSRR